MYQVQYTENAHVHVPEKCWINGTRHRTIAAARKAARGYHKRVNNFSWGNNVRIIDERTGDFVVVYTWKRQA